MSNVINLPVPTEQMYGSQLESSEDIDTIDLKAIHESIKVTDPEGESTRVVIGFFPGNEDLSSPSSSSTAYLLLEQLSENPTREFERGRASAIAHQTGADVFVVGNIGVGSHWIGEHKSDWLTDMQKTQLKLGNRPLTFFSSLIGKALFGDRVEDRIDMGNSSFNPIGFSQAQALNKFAATHLTPNYFKDRQVIVDAWSLGPNVWAGMKPHLGFKADAVIIGEIIDRGERVPFHKLAWPYLKYGGDGFSENAAKIQSVMGDRPDSIPGGTIRTMSNPFANANYARGVAGGSFRSDFKEGHDAGDGKASKYFVVGGEGLASPPALRHDTAEWLAAGLDADVYEIEVRNGQHSMANDVYLRGALASMAMRMAS